MPGGIESLRGGDLMPFKSEKQRRYLWALQEPEIARDWVDTYGSRIQKDVVGFSTARNRKRTFMIFLIM